MSLILHLSDLHLLANPKEQESIFDGLVGALREVRERYRGGADLSTGLERPLRLERSNGSVIAAHADCPARTLLRVYWPLDGSR